ncbi:hypothetical protein P3T76_015288 [Phytophthora citrophthora]|uniref:Uncharacterized protein n=1 Tax=Phytophthora citrophthora TaxID=4793 RepID=A0AAD9FZN0_9STRA|nr:hypothetical protein P3T76_015288 [Phytophthora citrophthora]
MTTISAIDWEPPIQVWIESISFDMDEEILDNFTTSPSTMDGTPATKTHSFISCQPSTDNETRTDMNVTLNIKEVKAVESPVKPTRPTTPTISPVKRKRAAKPSQKDNVDPSTVLGAKKRRRDKQHGYEKAYRSRMKSKLSSDKAEWIQLETQIRKLMAKRTSFVVLGALDKEKLETKPSTVSIRQRYLELLQEERALRESEALDKCIWANHQAMMFWGGGVAGRDIREQLNGLPTVRECHQFDFSW